MQRRTCFNSIAIVMAMTASAIAADLSDLRAPLPPVHKLSRPEMLALAQRARDYVIEHHMLTSEEARAGGQYGLTYEFYDTTNGKFYHGHGDQMHDLAWFGYGLAAMYRATGDRSFLEPITDKVGPLFTRTMLNSRKLFGTPVDGMSIYHWSNGNLYWLGMSNLDTPWPRFDHTTGPRFYSNHMAAQLNTFFGSAWVLTRDKDIAQAALLMARERCGDTNAKERISANDLSITSAAGVSHPESEFGKALAASGPGAPTLPDFRYHNFWKLEDQPTGQLRGQHALTAYNDSSVWKYNNFGLARWYEKDDTAWRQQQICEVLTTAAMTRLRHDTGFKWGYFGHDNDPNGDAHIAGGRLTLRDSELKAVHKPVAIGSRGLEWIYLSASALTLLNENPDAYTYAHRKLHPDLPVVHFTDHPPAIDGKAENDYDQHLTFALSETMSADVKLVSDIQNLYVHVVASEGTQVTIYHTDEGKPPFGRILLKADGVSVSNHDGSELLHQAHAVETEGRVNAEIQIPYTMATAKQPKWMNGLELRTYRLSVNDQQQTFFMQSSPQRAKAYLEAQVQGAIGAWSEVFDRFGYIPGGFAMDEPDGKWLLGPGARFGVDWSRVSDSGGYAHLLQAIAQWINYTSGTSEHRLLWKVRAEQTNSNNP